MERGLQGGKPQQAGYHGNGQCDAHNQTAAGGTPFLNTVAGTWEENMGWEKKHNRTSWKTYLSHGPAKSSL